MGPYEFHALLKRHEMPGGYPRVDIKAKMACAATVGSQPMLRIDCLITLLQPPKDHLSTTQN